MSQRQGRESLGGGTEHGETGRPTGSAYVAPARSPDRRRRQGGSRHRHAGLTEGESERGQEEEVNACGRKCGWRWGERSEVERGSRPGEGGRERVKAGRAGRQRGPLVRHRPQAVVVVAHDGAAGNTDAAAWSCRRAEGSDGGPHQRTKGHGMHGWAGVRDQEVGSRWCRLIWADVRPSAIVFWAVFRCHLDAIISRLIQTHC